MSALTKALIEVQKEIQDVCKDSVNPHFRANYASLEGVLQEVRRVLPKHGLAFTQELDGMVLRTKLLHVSGESTVSLCPLVLSKQDMQGLGSAITYARRYSLVSLLGIGQADDDAEGATQRHSKPRDEGDRLADSPVAEKPKIATSIRSQWTPDQMREFSIAKFGTASWKEMTLDQQKEVSEISKSQPFRVAMSNLGVKQQ